MAFPVKTAVWIFLQLNGKTQEKMLLLRLLNILHHKVPAGIKCFFELRTMLSIARTSKKHFLLRNIHYECKLFNCRSNIIFYLSSIYQNEYTKEIRFPLGGSGTGCVSLTGSGEFVDREIMNRPAKNTFNGATRFMIRAIRDGKVEDVRMIARPCRRPRNGDPYGFGVPMETLAGVPRFRNRKFELSDPEFSGHVVLSAFNPLILSCAGINGSVFSVKNR